MTIESRSALYARLVQVLGDEHAQTLMQHLPTSDPAGLATRADIEALGARLDDRMDRLDHRMDRLEGRMESFEERFFELSRHLYSELLSTTESVRRDMQTHADGFREEVRKQSRLFVISSLGSAATIGAAIVGAAAVL